MIKIKEQIRRIRKGDLQFFMPIVEDNIDYVYTLCKEKYGAIEAEKITIDIFMSLFNGIMGFILFKNSERLVTNLLKRSCKKHKLNYSNDSIDEIEKAPPLVLRKLLLNLSSTSKRKNIMSTAIVASAFIVVVLVIAVVASSIRIDKIYDARTLYTDSRIPETLYSKNYSNESIEIKSISRLGNKGMAIDAYLSDGSHEVYIWHEGELVETLHVSEDMTFITGNMMNDSYVFMDEHKIFQINSDGENLDSIKLSGDLIGSSPNNQYIVLKVEDNSSIVLDTSGLNVVEEIYGEFFCINNNGVAIYNDKQKTIVPELNLGDDEIIDAAIDSNGSIIVLYKNGLVEKYKDQVLLWGNQILFPSDSKKINNEHQIINSHILSGDERINIVVEYSGGVIFQSFDSNEGLQLVKTFETKHTGVAVPEPKLSADGRLLLISAKTPEENIAIRYNGIIDTTCMPMREVKLQSDSKLKFVNIESSDDNYFIYQFSESNNFEVFQFNIKN